MACANWLAGQERTDDVDIPATTATQPQGERQNNVYDNPEYNNDELLAPEHEVWDDGVFDTNSMKEAQPQPVYSQADIDRAIAARYVELEREYARNNKVGKDMSRELSTIVMNDFEMTPEEWESFLTRATASDLFNQVRREMPETSQTAQAAPAVAQ